MKAIVSTVIVAAVIACLAVIAVIYVIKNRRKGCCSDCAHCKYRCSGYPGDCAQGKVSGDER